MSNKSTGLKTKQLVSDSELREKILRALNKICNPVASTMGPFGRTVILSELEKEPIVTKDGVTVAEFAENLSDDCFENAVIKIVKQSAISTNALCGDGTTTSTVLVDAIVKNSQKYLSLGLSSRGIKSGIDLAVKAIVKRLEEISKPISSLEEIKNIATISANGDETIGEIIMLAVDEVGKDGAITIEDAKSFQTTLEIVDGFRIESGYLAHSFVTDQKRGVAQLLDPFVLVTDENISLVDQILPALEIAAKDSSSLLIVANEVESNSQALAALILNMIRGTMKVVAINAPKYGEEKRSILKDLALTTGATFITRENGLQLKNLKIGHLGKAKKVEISKTETIIVGGQGESEKIEERINLLKQEIRQEKELQVLETIQSRITRLSAGAAIIKIGALTSVEAVEKFHRVQDSLEAVRSSIEGGILPGGGISLLCANRVLNLLDDSILSESERAGIQIIKKALEMPFFTIAKNSDMIPEICFEKVKEEMNKFYDEEKTSEELENRCFAQGFNFLTKNYVFDMFSEGIIDPTKVVKFSLLNAVSAASALITTNFAIFQTNLR